MAKVMVEFIDKNGFKKHIEVPSCLTHIPRIGEGLKIKYKYGVVKNIYHEFCDDQYIIIEVEELTIDD